MCQRREYMSGVGGGVRAVGPVHKDPRGTRMSLGTRREADSKARDTDLSLTFVLG